MRVLKIGCGVVLPADYRAERAAGTAGHLLLVSETPCAFSYGGASTQLAAESIVLFEKDKPYSVAAVGEPLRCDWLEFDTEFDEDFFRSLELPFGVGLPFGDAAFVRALLQRLASAFYAAGHKRLELMDALLRTILMKTGEIVPLAALLSRTETRYPSLVSIRERIYQNPQEKWSVELLAGLVNMSRSYFQLRYRETFGVTVIADVIACKMGYARELLTATDYTIAHVAALCGYDNEEHFMRLFKKTCGETPTRYRRAHRNTG